MTKITTEKHIETYLKMKVEAIGGLCIKMGNVHRIGFPDRLICLPGEEIIFVEVKRADRTLDPAQMLWFRKLEALNFTCKKVDSYAAVDRLINDYLYAR